MIEKQIFEMGLNLEGEILCPELVGKNENNKCHLINDVLKSDSKETAFLSIPKQYENLSKFIIQTLRKLDIIVLKDHDLPSDSISKACCGISKANYCFIDISDNNYEGIVQLGMIKALEKVDVTLMLYHEGYDSTGLAMWQRKECEWAEDSLDSEVSEKIIELIRGARLKKQRNSS
jgi:hypothetical protein